MSRPQPALKGELHSWLWPVKVIRNDKAEGIHLLVQNLSHSPKSQWQTAVPLISEPREKREICNLEKKLSIVVSFWDFLIFLPQLVMVYYTWYKCVQQSTLPTDIRILHHYFVRHRTYFNFWVSLSLVALFFTIQQSDISTFMVFHVFVWDFRK